MSLARPIRAHIAAQAILHNYRLAKQRAGGRRAWAVIKADAYGHGQARAVAALRDEADGFAMLEAENAAALRESGVRQPILLLEGIFAARDAALVVSHGLHSVIHCAEQLDLLLSVAGDAPLSVALKLNTGMNRLGFTAATLPAALARLQARRTVDITLMTHFANADDARGIDWQLARFRDMAGNWQGKVCLANSAAILRHPQAGGDWVRPGIMLYGGSPFADQKAADFGLQPVMSLRSAIIGVQSLAAGERVGYGGSFTAEREMRIGIVACGYADGYPRHAPSGTPIAVGGQMTRTIGRVSMDMLACDLSDIPAAGIGTPVTLWGHGPGGVVDADAVAAAAGTISYELFCALAPRVPVTVDNG